MASYAIGIAVQVPFMAQELYTGPVTDALDGADTSWIVGLVVIALVSIARLVNRVPDRMIYPAEI